MFNVEVFEFEGDDINLVRNNETGEVRVGVNSIARAIGISERGLRQKSQEDKIFRSEQLRLPASDGKIYETLTIPVKKVQALLIRVNANLVRDLEAREKLRAYQEKLAIALHDYATKGYAVNSDKLPDIPHDHPIVVANSRMMDSIDRTLTIMENVVSQQQKHSERMDTLIEENRDVRKRLGIFDNTLGNAHLPTPSLLVQMDLDKQRESFENLCAVYASKVYGEGYNPIRIGQVRTMFYDELRKFHPDFDSYEPGSKDRKSTIRMIEDAGLLPNLYQYAFAMLKDDVKRK